MKQLQTKNSLSHTAGQVKLVALHSQTDVMRIELSENILDSLDFLDPDAVVGDVKVIEDVGRVILSEDLVDIQQALQDTGLAWKKCTEND